MNRSSRILLPAIALLAFAGAPPARAADAPPTDASLHALFDAMHASGMIDSVWKQVDGMMESSIRQANGGHPLNEAQQAIARDASHQVGEAMREALSWQKLEPMMMEVYRKTFTQADIDGIAAFYRSPAGRSMVEKMPTAMQHSMEGMQGLMRDVMPRIQQIAQDAGARIKAAADPAPVSPAAAN